MTIKARLKKSIVSYASPLHLKNPDPVEFHLEIGTGRRFTLSQRKNGSFKFP
jgi:hypothetical protein